MKAITLKDFISKRIRYLRLKNQMTQETLEERAGLGFNYIYKLENKPTNIKVDTIDKIIGALDTDIETFFGSHFDIENPELEQLFEELLKKSPEGQEKFLRIMHVLMEIIN